MKSILQLLAGTCLTLLATSPLAWADQSALTPQDMRQDLQVLKEEWLPLDNSFDQEAKRAFVRLVDQTSAAADQLTPAAFAMQVMRAAAIPRNGHTSASIAQYLGDDLPIRAWWFADGLYVIKTHPDFTRLLGARIERIGSMTVDAAQQAIRPLLSGTDQRARFLAPGYLVNPHLLKTIGATESVDRVALSMQLADGQAEELQLGPVAASDPGDERKSGLNRGYSVLIPDAKEMPGRWPHLLDEVKIQSPLYSARGDVSSHFLDAEKQVLYIRNDTSKSLDATPLTDKFAGIVMASILPSRPKHVIFDLRLNNGGDLFNSLLLTRALPRLLPPDGKVFVLVSRATFSAGLSTAAMLKGEGRDQVVLMGETMGDAGNFWSDGKKVKLPNSQIEVRYSSEFHDYEKGCTDPKSCYWPVVAFGPRGISIAPEVAIDVKFQDYAAGRDPVFQRALELTSED